MGGPHISLAAEKIGSIFGLPITNSILMTWLVMGVLSLFAYFASKNISKIPGTLQSIAEVVLDGLYSLFTSVVGTHYIDTFFPLIATIFLFVIVNNWAGLLPGVGSIGLKEAEATDETVIVEKATRPIVEEKAVTEKIQTSPTTPIAKTEELIAVTTRNEGTMTATTGETDKTAKETASTKLVPLFRGATADLNTTLAIALIAVFSIQYFGLKSLGLGYLKKFFNFSDPIMFGVGLLEIVSEFSRIISFAFRLFGNIFAGEVLLTVIAFLMPLFAPLPFLGLELFVGFIQALVFSMLTAVFLNMATISHAEH